MSAPARAWLTAVRANRSTVASFSTSPCPSKTPQWPCVGVLAQAHIRDHKQLGQLALDRGDRELHRPLLIPGARAFGVLLGGNAEQQNRAQPERRRLTSLRDHVAERQALDARHPSIGSRTCAVSDTNSGCTESIGAQLRLAHQPS